MDSITEAEFWVRLEFLVCEAFSRHAEKRYRFFWCDGFVPEQYVLDGPSPRVIGRSWICNGPQQAQWDFVLLLKHGSSSREAIDWASLIPAEGMAGWVSLDEGRAYVEIDPAAATPDLH